MESGYAHTKNAVSSTANVVALKTVRRLLLVWVMDVLGVTAGGGVPAGGVSAGLTEGPESGETVGEGAEDVEGPSGSAPVCSKGVAICEYNC